MHPRRHLGGRGLGGRGIGQRSTSAGYSPTTALLAAAATPTLTWVTGPTDNTPQLLLNGALVEGATVREQHSTDNTFATYSESTNTVDAAEDAANELDFTGIGALADGTWYVRMRIESSGHFPSLWSNTETETVDTTAPTLSSPTGTKNGETTASLSVSTNEGNGTIFWVVDTNTTTPSAAQVKLGKDQGGNAADDSGSQAVSTTGVQAISGGADGLTGSTTYKAFFMHEDALGNQSTVSAQSGTFTTDAGAASLALDGSATNTMTGSNTGTVTLTTTLTHDIIVLAVMSENNGGTARNITSVSDVAGLTWAQRATIAGTDTGTTLDIWWAHAPAALSGDVITYTLSGTIDDAAVVAFGVNGSSNTAAPWDTNVSLPANAKTGSLSNTASVPGISTTATNTMLVGVAGDGSTVGSHSYSPDTGFTNIAGTYNGGGSRAAGIGSQYKVVAATQSGITLNSAISTSVRWTMYADAIR